MDNEKCKHDLTRGTCAVCNRAERVEAAIRVVKAKRAVKQDGDQKRDAIEEIRGPDVSNIVDELETGVLSKAIRILIISGRLELKHLAQAVSLITNRDN